MSILREFLAALGLLVASLLLAAPATATLVHGVDHIAIPVSSGEHHHHLSGGDVDMHDAATADQTDDQSGEKGVGHSHPPTIAADHATLGASALTYPCTATRMPQEWAVLELRTRTLSPHRRPPRTA